MNKLLTYEQLLQIREDVIEQIISGENWDIETSVKMADMILGDHYIGENFPELEDALRKIKTNN